MYLEKLLGGAAMLLTAALIALQGVHAVAALHLAAAFWRDHIAANL